LKKARSVAVPDVTSKHSSETLFKEAQLYAPGGVNSAARALVPPIVWRDAQGSKLYDVDGKEYIDYHAAFGPIVLGHNYPGVNQKVVEALESVDLVGNGTTEAEIRLTAKLCEHIPCAELALLCVTGSEATFNTVRLARAVTGRKKLIKFQGCFHGSNDYLCMNVISPPEKLGHYDPCSAGILDEAMRHTIVLNFNRIEEVENTLRREKDQIAAIILELIPHNIGCVLPKIEFLKGLRELADLHGVVLIFDEVITGFRHGLGGYQQVCGVTPDLTTLAKSMANGFPIAAVCGKRHLMERYQTAGGDVFFAGTYNGHPIGVAAAKATIQILEDGRVHDWLFQMGEMLACGLSTLMERYGIRGHVAHFGSVVVPYFLDPPIENYTDLLRNDTAMDLRFRREMVNRGIFMLPVAMKRNHLTASHTKEDVARTLNAAEDVLKVLSKGL
jgi:glutamate-1-semialdehyde 2,1-aminomutase